MGDFNEVRSIDERLGSVFNHSSARSFNHFISSSGLVDVKLEGYSFTWSLPPATKMSKLDRFLVSEGIISLFPSLTSICLDRHLSDHRPILLREINSDYGPIPFRFYHSWFKWDGFDDMVEHTWNSFSHSDNNSLIRFKKKLQDLKIIIRRWVKDKKSQQYDVIKSIKEDLIVIDKIFDSGNVSDEMLFNRMELTRQLQDIKQMDVRDNMQKSKIKWAIKGDENSKYFHGIINKKRTQLSIRGVFVDGNWTTDPKEVKEVFKDHFANRFKQPVQGRLKLNASFPNRLSTDQVADIDRCISRDEIRASSFGFGVRISLPGPDGGGINETTNISYLFYAEDAVFIGEWSDSNMENIVCFYDWLVLTVFKISFCDILSVMVGDPFMSRDNQLGVTTTVVVLDSSLCPICGEVPEDIFHVLFRCDIAMLVFRKICRWWDLDWQDRKIFPEESIVPGQQETRTGRQDLSRRINYSRSARNYNRKTSKTLACCSPDHRIHKDGDGDASFQLESNSLPHAHAQTTKTYYKHQDSRIMKAQELKTKTSAQTLIYKIFLQRYQVYQGRLLASFQDDAKYEHVGQDTRLQGGKDDQDKQGKDLKILDIKTKSKDNDKGSRSKITKHEGTSLQRIQRPRPQDLNDKSNLINLMKECHNELTSGEIVSLKILSRTMEVRSLY
ncbi:RNA-directed DNA polymerase, eukaryota [Tanacetum coccineum]